MVKGIQIETQKQLEGVEKRLKMETKTIKTLVKNEIEADKEVLVACMNEITQRIEVAKNKISGELGNTKNHLVENND